MNPKCILLSERNLYEMAVSCMIPIMWCSEQDKTIDMGKDQWFPGKEGREEH